MRTKSHYRSPAHRRDIKYRSCPENKENITLYQFENWHIRYVGMDAAKIIYENKLTLEEYIDLYETEY